MKKKTVRDLDVTGKRVLVRVDFNVPLKGDQVADDTRIRAALPTIEYLIEKGASVILMSHLGRPKDGPDPKYSMKPTAARLAELLGKPVAFVEECVGPKAEAAASRLKPGDVLVLETKGRPRTIPSSPSRWLSSRRSMLTMPSAPRTALTPPRKALPNSCLLWPVF